MKMIRTISALAIVASLAACAQPGTLANPYPDAQYSNPQYRTNQYNSVPNYNTQAPNYNSQNYDNRNNYSGNYVNRMATVQSVRQVQVQTGSPSGVGVIAGGVGGGVIGNQFGKGNGRTAATLLGIVGGAVAGNQIEKRNYNTSNALEIQVNVDGGGSTIVTQVDQGQRFFPGSRVRMVQDTNGVLMVTY